MFIPVIAKLNELQTMASRYIDKLARLIYNMEIIG